MNTINANKFLKRGLMINFIIKKFIKDYENINDQKVRESYGCLLYTSRCV